MKRKILLEYAEQLIRIYKNKDIDSTKIKKIIESISSSLIPLTEKWDAEMKTKKKDIGKWEGWTLSDLKKRRNELKNKKEHSSKDTTELRQINFAIQAKTGWGKIN